MVSLRAFWGEKGQKMVKNRGKMEHWDYRGG